MLRRGVQSISDLIAVVGLVNLDFADVKAVMEHSGNAIIGIGIGMGEDRAIEAAQQAVSSPLFGNIDYRRNRCHHQYYWWCKLNVI